MQKLKQRPRQKKVPTPKAIAGPRKRPACEVESVAEHPGIQNEFSIDEHLRVQRLIEERAHSLWDIHSDPSGDELGHWLKAENEVLAEFIAQRMAEADKIPAASGGCLVGGAGRQWHGAPRAFCKQNTPLETTWRNCTL